jgi:hypothetical protein
MIPEALARQLGLLFARQFIAIGRDQADLCTA